MECFIPKVYQRFYDEFKVYFGTTIKAIFTDEPNPTGRGRKKRLDARTGTRDIVPQVSRILGYDFTLSCLLFGMIVNPMFRGFGTRLRPCGGSEARGDLLCAHIGMV